MTAILFFRNSEWVKNISKYVLWADCSLQPLQAIISQTVGDGNDSNRDITNESIVTKIIWRLPPKLVKAYWKFDQSILNSIFYRGGEEKFCPEKLKTMAVIEPEKERDEK